MNLMALSLAAGNEEAVETAFLNTLAPIVDLNGTLINITVDRGVSAEILDAIMATPLDSVCPLVRLNAWTQTMEMSVGGNAVWVKYLMSLYFFYYFGVPSNDPTYLASSINYTTQRQRHLRANRNALVMQSGGNTNATIPVSAVWKPDNTRNIILDFEAPFRYFGGQVIAKNGYDCVRMDYPIWLKA